MGEAKIKALIGCILLIVFIAAGIILDGEQAIADDGAERLSQVDSTSTAETPPDLAFLPMIIKSAAMVGPTLDPPIRHTGTPPLDFDTIRTSLRAAGKDLAFNKIGFHLGPGGNPTGYVDWLTALDAAGIPFFIKSVDDAGRLDPAVEIAKNSAVPHSILFRKSGLPYYDVPDYQKDPAEAAEEHWNRHIEVFTTTGLDKEYVWLETINEVDKNKSEWLGEFAYETAQLALRDGYKWAAFGWSSGEPEPYQWESPSMLKFLSLAGEHPDQIAVALHEYSYVDDDLGYIYPWHVGRLQKLFEVCDENNIPRPTVFITEFGWTYNDLPTPDQAIEQLDWAAWLYSAYPTVRGAAIWYLGGWFNIEQETQALIAPVTEYTLSHYFEYIPGSGIIDSQLFTPPAWSLDNQQWSGNRYFAEPPSLAD